MRLDDLLLTIATAVWCLIWAGFILIGAILYLSYHLTKLVKRGRGERR